MNLFTERDAYPQPRISDLVNSLAQYKAFSTFGLKSANHQIQISECDRKYTAFEACRQLWEFTRVSFGVTKEVSVFQEQMDQLNACNRLIDTFPYLDNITVGGQTREELDENVNQLLRALKEKRFTLNEEKTVSAVFKINILNYCVGQRCCQSRPRKVQTSSARKQTGITEIARIVCVLCDVGSQFH